MNIFPFAQKDNSIDELDQFILFQRFRRNCSVIWFSNYKQKTIIIESQGILVHCIVLTRRYIKRYI